MQRHSVYSETLTSKELLLNTSDGGMFDVNLYSCCMTTLHDNQAFRVDREVPYLFLYVIDGNCNCETVSGNVLVKEGELALFHDKKVLGLTSLKDSTCTFALIQLSGIRLRQIQITLGMNDEIPVQLKNGKELFVKFTDEVFSHRLNKLEDQIFRNRAVLDLLLNLIEAVRDSKGNNIDYRDNVYIASAINFIRTEYNEDISVQTIADYLGISRSYFSSLFEKCTGETPRRFLLRTRMTAASEYLSASTKSIGEISELCGFKNAYSFSTTFKKNGSMIFGMG